MLKVELQGKDIKMLQIKGGVDDVISDVASLIDEVLTHMHDVTDGKLDKKEMLKDIVGFVEFWWEFKEQNKDINDLK